MSRRSRLKARLSEFGANVSDDQSTQELEPADKRPCLDRGQSASTATVCVDVNLVSLVKAGAAKEAEVADSGEGSGQGPAAEISVPRPVEGAAPTIPRGTFICVGQTGEIVQRILRRWGWEENKDASSRVFDFKWTTQLRHVEDLVTSKSQLVNHFRGADFLNHKSRMGRYLGRCPGCSDLFFPRQYNLYSAKALRRFLTDIIVTQASVCLHRREGQDAEHLAAVRRTALRVLQRQREDPCRASPLLRCIHECELLFGAGCQVPPGEEVKLRPLVDEWLEGKTTSECSVCAASGGKPGDGDTCSMAGVCSRSPTASTEGCSEPSSSEGQSFGEQELATAASSTWQQSLSGPANAWVVKDPCLSRGRSVTVLTGLRSILTHCERSHSCGLRWNCVVQKYIERPLLVPNSNGDSGFLSKADLRAWVLVLDWNPLIAFAHPEVYFRVATKPYEFQATGRAETYAHATNCRDEDNRVTMRSLFARCGPSAARLWESRTWPQLLDGVRASLLAVRDGVLGVDLDFKRKKKLDNTAGPRAFELFGFDFAVDEAWRPWLLEANSSPDMLKSCVVPEITAWAEEATESMLRMALLHRNGGLNVPKASELERCSPPGTPSGAPVERLFGPSELEGSGHCREKCYGEVVARVPECLVRGMELGPECSGWRLILRERVVDEATVWQSYVAQEHDVCDMGSENLSHGRVLREQLLPGSSSGGTQRRQALAELQQQRQELQQQQRQEQRRGTASLRAGTSVTVPVAPRLSQTLRSSRSLSTLRRTVPAQPASAPAPTMTNLELASEAVPSLAATSPRNSRGCKSEAQQSSGMLVRGLPLLPPLP